MGFEDQPFPDDTNIRSSKCYKPDGSLGSEVINGTGVRTIWTPEGIKTWEEELKDYKRVKLMMWFSNGQLLREFGYIDGHKDGPFVGYNEEGRVVIEGSYKLGFPDGEWKRYYDNGQLRLVETYVDNLLDGPYILYGEDGHKIREGSYKAYEQVGRWIEYNEDGSIHSEENFDKEKD